MSGLLERLVVALETIAASSAAKPAPAGAATPPKPPTATANAAAAGKAADKAAAETKAKAEATAAAKAKAEATAAAKAGAAGKPAAGNTKAPGGKYNAEQVRDIIRKVAANPSLGKQSAREVLEQDGGGVATVSEVKPENYDAVYEACQVLLSGEGGSTPGADDFDPTA